MILAQKLQGKTPVEKMRWLHRAIELLRLQHNNKGADFRNGVITEQEWNEYLVTFENRNKKLLRAMNIVRENHGITELTKAERDQMKTVWLDGRDATDLDADIDIDVIED